MTPRSCPPLPRAFRTQSVALATVVLLACLEPVAVLAADRANVPLKNWGGFSVLRDAVYDDLERLVTSGVADRTVLNTKPMSRTEAARVVAAAIARIRGDERGMYNTRGDLEAVLDRLIEEFRAELPALGVKTSHDAPVPQGGLSFMPVDRAQVRGAYANHDRSVINSQGLRLRSGLNGGTTFESRAQVGDFLTLYAQPTFDMNQEYQQGRLASGYGKLTLYNVELLVGRESLWWGPGLFGSLILSNNAPPLDQIRIGAAEPFLLPWIGKWIGPTKVLGFLAQLEQRREHPRAKLAGLRGTISPFTVLELGASYANMFDGTDKPRLSLGDYPRALFDPNAADQKDPNHLRFRNNALLALDADLRLRNVNQYFMPWRDMRVYGEFGWDDTCCSTFYLPLKEAASGLVGVHLLGLFDNEDLDGRVELAVSSKQSFTHNQFTRGYWTRGHAISHVIGTDGSSLTTRITNRVTPDVMVGGGLSRMVIGNTLSGASATQEHRFGANLDVSYRFARVYTLFGQLEVARVTDRNFVAGDNGFDTIVLLELTRSFR